MGRWMNVRLLLHKYNSYLLYGMCTMIFVTQLGMVYVHKTGGEARVRPEDLFKKGEYIQKLEGLISKFYKPKAKILNLRESSKDHKEKKE